MADEDIPFDHEFAATPAMDKRMARAMVAWQFRNGRFRFVVGGAPVVMAVYFYVSGYNDSDLGMTGRLFASAFWATVFALLLVLVLVALIYFSNRRVLRQTTQPGSVMRTGFGSEEFVTSNALSSSRFSYQAVSSIDAIGGFVLIRYVGNPVIRIYPNELFPADALQRLKTEAAANRERP